MAPVPAPAPLDNSQCFHVTPNDKKRRGESIPPAESVTTDSVAWMPLPAPLLVTHIINGHKKQEGKGKDLTCRVCKRRELLFLRLGRHVLPRLDHVQVHVPLLPVLPLNLPAEPDLLRLLLVIKREADLPLSGGMLLHPAAEVVYPLLDLFLNAGVPALHVSDVKELGVDVAGAHEPQGAVEHDGVEDTCEKETEFWTLCAFGRTRGASGKR